MRLDESDGKRTLLVSDDEWIDFIVNVLAANKTSLGKLLDPVLRGRKIDYLRKENDPLTRNLLLNLHFVNSFSPSPVPGKDDFSVRSIATLLPYISDKSIEQMIDLYPYTENLVKKALTMGEYTQVMGQLDEKASEFRTRGRHDKLRHGIVSTGTANLMKQTTPDFSVPNLPPPEYRELLPTYKKSGTRSRKRRTRKTNRRKY